MRSRGLSTSYLRSSALTPCSYHAALDIDGLIALFTGYTISDIGKPAKEFVFDDGAEERLEKAMSFLCLECPSFQAESAPSYSGHEMLCHLSETHGHLDITRCLLCVWNGSLRGLETHVRGHFKKGPVACLVCDDKDVVPLDSYVLWYAHLDALHERDGLAGLKPPPKETQNRIAGTKRKRSRCREMELKLDFEERTATELD